MSGTFTPEERAAYAEAVAEQRRKNKEYCDSLIGKTRDEATKINMANGYHTKAYYPGDFTTFDSVLNRICLYLSENNVVTSAHKG